MTSIEYMVGILSVPALIIAIAIMKKRIRKNQNHFEFDEDYVDNSVNYPKQHKQKCKIFVQFVSIPNLNTTDLFNENTLFDHPFLRSVEISDALCEHNILKAQTANLIFEYFKLEPQLIYENVWKLKFRNFDALTNTYLDENYQNWIEASGQENTMDEYGSLLGIQNLLKTHSNDEVFAVLRIKNAIGNESENDFS